jgi:hypothetical protein
LPCSPLLVAERTVGQRSQQLGFNDRDVSDDRCRAIEDIGQRTEGSGRIALGEQIAARALRISPELACSSVRAARAARLDRASRGGLGWSGSSRSPCSPARGSLELRLQTFGRAELLQGLVVAAAAGVEPPGRQVQQLPRCPARCRFAGPCGALQPSLGFRQARPSRRGCRPA